MVIYYKALAMSYSVDIPQELTIEDLLREIKTYEHSSDLEMVRLAYDFAARAHTGQTRKSGEPYIIHPLSAAYILAQMHIDTPIIIATLLQYPTAHPRQRKWRGGSYPSPPNSDPEPESLHWRRLVPRNTRP
jgi:hypothetical protein